MDIVTVLDELWIQDIIRMLQIYTYVVAPTEMMSEKSILITFKGWSCKHTNEML